MGVIFDPAKSESNVKKHGISLDRAEDFDYASAFYDVDNSQDYGEVRYNAIGWLDTILHTLTLLRTASSFERSVFVRRPDRSKPSMTRNRSLKSVPDAENPEWTPEKFARSIRLDELPESLREAISRGKRGPQKAPTKTLISLRLSPDVLAALRATGKGWQSTVDDALRREFIK